MQKVFHTIFACIILYSCAAQRQGSIKIFAYRQPVLQGAHPTVIVDDKGNTTETVIKERANYFIYVESPSADIKIVDLWVRKVQYKAGVENVPATPVLMLTSIMPNAKPDTLVKQTSNKVLRVSIEPGSDNAKPSSGLQKKINGNELVMHCIINGKDYYYTVKAIKNLPPVALQ